MSGLDNLNTRLRYYGGNQQGRMNADKLRGLRKALLYSYQAVTLIMPLREGEDEPRKFRALINPDKTKNDYDQKIVSIPFKDICLNKEREGKTSDGMEEVGLKTGDVFEWEENHTHWLVYLRDYNEVAYFMSEIRRCDTSIEINGHEYWLYVRGPVETTIPWNQKQGILWNTPNYTLNIYITKNKETDEFFHRFQKVKIYGKSWEVQTVDRIGGDDILEITLKEAYTNSIEDAELEIRKEEEEGQEQPPLIEPYILGEDVVYPYDVKSYSIVGLPPEGEWTISDNKKAKFLECKDGRVTIEITTTRSGNFNLSYIVENTLVELSIKVDSL